jgi:Transglycosylase SLT domain
MPAGGGEIIREFLVGLGFTVNDTQLRSFNYAINRVASLTLGSMNRMAAGVAIAGASVAADILLIANSLEKMYYNSRLAGTTVTNLKAVQEGAKQVGVSAEKMNSAMVDFGFRLKTSYSLRYLVQGLLGVKTEGRDSVDIIKDMVLALHRLPPELQTIYEKILGLDPQTFFLLAQGAQKFADNVDAAKAKFGGLDKLSKDAVNLENQIDLLKQSWDQLSFSMESWAVGPVTSVVKGLNQLSEAGVKSQDRGSIYKLWYGTRGKEEGPQGNLFTNPGGIIQKMWFGNQGKAGNPQGNIAGDALNKYSDFSHWVMGGVRGIRGGDMPPALKAPGPPNLQGMSMQDKVRQYAKMFGLPEDLMLRLVQRESQFNPRAKSPKGAKGLMQLMDKTGAAYGVRDPYNPDQNLAGGMQFFSELLKQFGGDVNLALAAYNAGPDAVIKHDALHKYKETREYVNAINGTKLGAGGAGSGVTINSKTDIHVNGAGDPKAVAGNVAAEQKRVDADNLRNAKGVVD